MTNRDALSVLLDECETCGGLGSVTSRRAETEREWLEGTHQEPCPDCVDGLIIAEAVVEAAAEAAFQVLGTGVSARPLTTDTTIYHITATAALEAAVRVLMEEEL